MGTQNEAGIKVQLFVNCEFGLVVFSFVLFSYFSGWSRTLALLAANHVLRANSKGKIDAKQVSGRFKAMCQPEEWRVYFKHEKRSGTEKVPGGRERKKGCEKKKLFFPNSLKR